MSVINNNKNSLVVTSVKLVGTNLEVEYSEVQLLTAKVKKPCKKEIISLV